MENRDVRRAARAAGVPLWKIARQLGVSEPTMTRWLRTPLSSEKREAVLGAISELEEEGNGD